MLRVTILYHEATISFQLLNLCLKLHELAGLRWEFPAQKLQEEVEALNRIPLYDGSTLSGAIQGVFALGGGQSGSTGSLNPGMWIRHAFRFILEIETVPCYS
jgi:hypothetical protein